MLSEDKPFVAGLINSMIENDEGGWVYTDHPADPDKGTYAGIRFKTFKKWIISKQWEDAEQFTPEDFKKEATADDAEQIFRDFILQIYYDKYYLPARCNIVGNTLERPMFSCAVNIGPKEAIRTLQRAYNMAVLGPALIEDGIWGPITEAGMQLSMYVMKPPFMREWFRYYIHILENDWKKGRSDRIVFLEGWFNRVEKNRLYNG